MTDEALARIRARLGRVGRAEREYVEAPPATWMRAGYVHVWWIGADVRAALPVAVVGEEAIRTGKLRGEVVVRIQGVDVTLGVWDYVPCGGSGCAIKGCNETA